MKLTLFSDRFAICRLDFDSAIPSWAQSPTFLSITRTSAELSIVCAEESVPADVRADRGWRCLRVEGPIPFETTGVAASLTGPLAANNISVFLVATFDTDYVLVKATTLDAALEALRSASHIIE